MNAEHFKKLKHELRTPLNHILGYSELLMEIANDAGDSAVASQAESIQTHGRMLAMLIEKNFSFALLEIDGAGMDEQRNTLRPVIDRILEAASPSPVPLSPASYSSDLEKIRKAAHQLMVFLDGNMASVSQ